MKTNLNRINHIVVLMLENRSFDNMLGWLYDPANSPPFDKVPRGQLFNGLSGKNLSNFIPDYALDADKKFVPVGKSSIMTNPNPDPGEEYYHVNIQLFGNLIPQENRFEPFDRKPYNLPENLPEIAPMNGFITDYINNFVALKGREPNYDEYKIIMECFTHDKVPIISTLANSYAVCDNWHCSVPSQTFCNRSFVHSGTSSGLVVNSPYVNWLFTSAKTIFNLIEDDTREELNWKVYFDEMDIIPFTWLLNPKIRKYRKTNFFHMDKFFKDAKEGTLPSYAFIEPRLLINHNDQHPPIADPLVTSSVLAGEILINDVYQAIRNGKNWEKTLLIITYDEHGGCYDHVPPPSTVPPEPNEPTGQFDFKFDRLGVRVPAVLVSAYIEAGTVVNTLFDHTSIIKTITKRWGLNHLTERDRLANDLSEVLTLDKPRTDFPNIVPRSYTPSGEAENEPLSPLQRAILILVAGVEGFDEIEKDKSVTEKIKDLIQLAEKEIEIANLKTVGDGVKFLTTKLQNYNSDKKISFFKFILTLLKVIWSKISSFSKQNARGD